jgi:type I restriction enzyme R subunit
MNEYCENAMVQDSAADCLQNELGWDVVYAYNTEQLRSDGTLGRSSYREVVLLRELKQALKRLNPWITPKQIEEAVQKLTTYVSTASPLRINEEKYFLIRDGVPVTVRTPDGRTTERIARVLDFQQSKQNHFLAVKEMWIQGPMYKRRTDIVGFVNGLPLLFMEFKRHDVDVQDAFDRNYTDYQDTIPELFHYNAMVILSNGMQAKIGTLGSKYEFFHEWKRLSEDQQGYVDLHTMLLGVCRKENFLDLFENFILFDHSNGHTAKILSRNHQYLGVNEAVKAYENRELREGKLGVFWHTQGSGKSYSMVFLAQKIRRKFEGSPTIVVLTDRDELNKQISDTFENCGLLGAAPAKQFIATSGSDLVKKLKGNPSFIFSLIHKFNQKNVPPIKTGHDILIMSDEAHRTQNGVFAENMMALLPTACRIGFTGTPLFSNDNITERTFGGYVSIYDFKRAVEDGATVPLYYENRGERLEELKNPEINDLILDAIDRADLDPSQQEKLEREFAKEIHLLTAEDRLRAIAKDFAGHYSDLWTSGKAMFVCLNKVTCVRMYNYVQEYWQQEKEELKRQVKAATQQEAQELHRKLQWMEETEMAVVISQEQNEIQTFQKWGLDILPHRDKMEKRELDKEFKDASNPFRVVFVCAMWLTGFDVKCLSCLYLDKPLKAHTLMQTIARANRVAEGKSNGLILDYVGIVKALRKALADYTANVNGPARNDPTVDKEQLLARISEDIYTATVFLKTHGFRLSDLTEASGFKKTMLLQDAANAMSESLEVKKTFQTYTSELSRLVKYVNRNELTKETLGQKDALLEIDKELRNKRRHADNTDLMVEINQIVNEFVTVEIQSDGIIESKQFDISQINFDLLRREFQRVKRKHLILKDLDDLVQDRLDKMMFENPNRTDFYTRYQNIISEYNQEQDRATIENTFMELMDLAKSMSEEQQRYTREGFDSDEELSLFDMLFRDDLSAKEIDCIKKIASELLIKIKTTIATMDHWTEKRETQAAVDTLIRNTLLAQLPDCYDYDEIQIHKQQIYEHVYVRYGNVA